MKYKKRDKVLKRIIKKHQLGIEKTQRYGYLNTKKYGYQKINKYFIGKNVLELGTDGTATSSILVRWSKKLTVVDMTDKFSDQTKKDKRLKKAKFVLSKWEEFQPKDKFTDIFLTDSLEHVENPIELLKIIKKWLCENGKLHIIVPNALSIHRLVGVEMRYLSSPYELNSNDIEAQHVKVYDQNILKQELENADMKLIACEGIQLKANTDIQLANLSDEFSDALNSISYLFNDNCAEIYACCMK